VWLKQGREEVGEQLLLFLGQTTEEFVQCLLCADCDVLSDIKKVYGIFF